jgi:hypothetical protein
VYTTGSPVAGSMTVARLTLINKGPRQRPVYVKRACKALELSEVGRGQAGRSEGAYCRGGGRSAVTDRRRVGSHVPEVTCVELGRGSRGHGTTEFVSKFLGPDARCLSLAGGAGGTVSPPRNIGTTAELEHELYSEAGAVGGVPDVGSVVRMAPVQKGPETQPCWEGRVRLATREEA